MSQRRYTESRLVSQHSFTDDTLLGVHRNLFPVRTETRKDER